MAGLISRASRKCRSAAVACKQCKIYGPRNREPEHEVEESWADAAAAAARGGRNRRRGTAGGRAADGRRVVRHRPHHPRRRRPLLRQARAAQAQGRERPRQARCSSAITTTSPRLRRAGEIVPGAAPARAGRGPGARHRAVSSNTSPPEDFRLWKTELLAGRGDPATPAAAADAPGRIHAATLDDAATAAAFDTDSLFRCAAARSLPSARSRRRLAQPCAKPILGVPRRNGGDQNRAVHGDVSPKNILVSRRGRPSGAASRRRVRLVRRSARSMPPSASTICCSRRCT